MQQGAASGSGSDGKGGSSAAGRTATPVKARFGFIGIGKMATAIIKGMLDSGMSTSENIIGSAPSDRNMGPLKEMGVKTTHDNLEVAQRSTVIVLAVKPQLLWPVVEQIRSRVTPGHLIVSVVAGVSTEQLAAAFGKGTRVVRVVPNTPCAIRHGTTAVTAGSNATPQDTELVRSIFEQMGVVRVLPERVMDVVTGLAGSGPAFVFLFLEALSDGAVQAGLPRDVAHEFAASMVHGAAALAKETRTHPGVLKDAVCSPGGTTIAGVRSLEDARFRAAAMGAVTTAAARSEELRLKGPSPAALAAYLAASRGAGGATPTSAAPGFGKYEGSFESSTKAVVPSGEAPAAAAARGSPVAAAGEGGSGAADGGRYVGKRRTVNPW